MNTLFTAIDLLVKIAYYTVHIFFNPLVFITIMIGIVVMDVRTYKREQLKKKPVNERKTGRKTF